MGNRWQIWENFIWKVFFFGHIMAPTLKDSNPQMPSASLSLLVSEVRHCQPYQCTQKSADLKMFSACRMEGQLPDHILWDIFLLVSVLMIRHISSCQFINDKTYFCLSVSWWSDKYLLVKQILRHISVSQFTKDWTHFCLSVYKWSYTFLLVSI